MAPLFSIADLNTFLRDVRNEVTLFCAKFGKDLFSISKVIGRKTKWPRFWPTLYITVGLCRQPTTRQESIFNASVNYESLSRPTKHLACIELMRLLTIRDCWLDEYAASVLLVVLLFITFRFIILLISC